MESYAWVKELAADWEWAEARRAVLAPVVELSYHRAGRPLVEPLVRASVRWAGAPVALGGDFSSFDFDVYRPRTRSTVPPVHGAELWGARVLERDASLEDARVGHSVLWWVTKGSESLARVRCEGKELELGERELGVLTTLADTSASLEELLSARAVLTDVLTGLGVVPASVPARAEVELVPVLDPSDLEKKAAALTLAPLVRSGVSHLEEAELSLVVALLRRWVSTEAVLEAYVTVLGDAGSSGLTTLSALGTARALEDS
jgi:hypothetical protein